MSGELTGFGANVQKIVIDKHGRPPISKRLPVCSKHMTKSSSVMLITSVPDNFKISVLVCADTVTFLWARTP